MKALILAPALLLALPVAAPTDAQPYRAVGTEPFWSLTIDGSTIRYEAIGGRVVTVARPRPIVGINGELYRTPRMTVDITHVRCNDGLSDRRYADTVRVQIGRESVSGCGGAIVGGSASTPLIGTWRIDMVDGRPVRLQQPATLRFDSDRVSGQICNGFGGAYRFVRGTLTTREIIGTQMACLDGRTQLETRVFAALRQPLKVHRGSRADTLVLANGRTSLTLRRSE